MDICNCTVHLGGSRDMAVSKSGVTPAEILILQAMHGHDAVVRIQPAGKVKRSNAEEKDRLASVYIAKLPDSEEETFVSKLFPGFDPRMPTELKALGLDAAFYAPAAPAVAPVEIEEVEEEPAPAPAPSKRGRKASVSSAGGKPVLEIETPDLDAAIRAAAEAGDEDADEAGEPDDNVSSEV
jgi:hypothetical protein